MEEEKLGWGGGGDSGWSVGSGRVDGECDSRCEGRSGDAGGDNVLPEGVAGPQSLTFDVDLVQALTVSRRGSPSVHAVKGEEAGVVFKVVEEGGQGSGQDGDSDCGATMAKTG